ncbi:MAG: NAD(P)H-dependent oxidoreductase [Clostridia bacterium]|nr:NAD(P)H-dependent oxidoreductase [Clostridia bacterium]
MVQLLEARDCVLRDGVDHDIEKDGVYKGVLVIQLDDIGSNCPFLQWLLEKKKQSEDYFENSVIGVIVKSDSTLYTKKFASKVIYLLNEMGARVLGHSAIEFIEDYKNLAQWQIAENLSKEGVIELMVYRLLNRLEAYVNDKPSHPKILVLHASTHDSSNTLALWNMVRANLPYEDITEFHVEEGTAIDCYGCSFEACNYFSQHKSCFYGGVITEELLPLIEASDVVVWICPNYNDALSAKLTAVINRLTVLYRRVSFSKKKVYAVIVSANSGSDSVGSQLIDALVMNKGFQLPPNFALTELSSDKGSIYKVPHIQEKAKAFAEHMARECL